MGVASSPLPAGKPKTEKRTVGEECDAYKSKVGRGADRGTIADEVARRVIFRLNKQV